MVDGDGSRESAYVNSLFRVGVLTESITLPRSKFHRTWVDKNTHGDGKERKGETVFPFLVNI